MLLIARRLFLVGLLALVSCSTPASPTPTTVPAPNESTPSGTLTIYTGRTEALFKPVIAAFNTRYPQVQVTLLTGKNNELGAKILEERANPVADLFVGTDTLSMEALAAEGVFVPNDSPAVQAVPEIYRAADGNWVSLTLRPRVIMYNTELVKPEELPTSIFDLTDPKWSGQIGAADSTNGAIMAHLVAIRNLKGADVAQQFVEQLVANNTQFFGGHTEVRKAVGAGELKLGLVNHYYYHLSKAEGAPVGIIYPDQGNGEMGLVVNTTNAGIVKNAPHADLARLFLDFMLSPEGQRIYAELNFEYPVVQGVALAEGVPPLSQFRLADVTLKTMWEELGPTRTMAQAAGLP